MSWEPLEEKDWEPMTPGMLFAVAGDRARAIYDLDRKKIGGVIFSHKNPSKLPNDELLQLAQMNTSVPENLLGEIARRGLQGDFNRLWIAGQAGGQPND